MIDKDLETRHEMPPTADPEERARELAARDYVIQHAMSKIGLGNIPIEELTTPPARNEDTERI